jgi:hypothetical protein
VQCVEKAGEPAVLRVDGRRLEAYRQPAQGSGGRVADAGSGTEAQAVAWFYQKIKYVGIFMTPVCRSFERSGFFVVRFLPGNILPK